MVRDVGDGYILVNERTFARMSSPDLDRIGFEMDRRLREVRGSQPDQTDVKALQLRNRKLQRLTSAKSMLQAFRRKRRK
ncbi:MAG: hypothetical protein GY769_11200 [bacterium]|nr:hypothetical protein [bacterium]